ncbi:MAG: peptidase C45 acyl-coenzyme A:6-aminopenicillanic acid acyl-transferase [Fuerstia sp.]|nr:peptidase C45 acyl-coenzyme A:6-aminopenicillanic acid acyl-transferase [Fuerstiella sp.]
MRFGHSIKHCVLTLTFAILTCASQGLTLADQPKDLASALTPLASALSGRLPQFEVTGHVTVPIDGSTQPIDVRIVRYDDESFDLALTHADYAIEIRRRADVTAMALPKHGAVFIGRGFVDGVDSLKPMAIADRLISKSSSLGKLSFGLNLLAAGDIEATLRGLLATANFIHDPSNGCWKSGDATVTCPKEQSISVSANDVNVSLDTKAEVGVAPSAEEWPGMKVTELPRGELERTLLCGVRRATEVLQPGDVLTKPSQSPRSTGNGSLTWIDGQRVATLWGTPEEIGTAHGKLLPEESRRCIESVLYSFGMVNTVRTGRWFRHDLEAAYARLSPYIPERHKRETQALAVSLGMEPEIVQVLNVFPELFHCSGFAVFGTATKDGKLYHGRVLDYMTTIGLQDSATTFIVRAEGQIPFANVGYAGFIGSVSGMNAEGISLGEMGGRGEGQWDGAPMATLMRRAMEECDSLQEVQDLWTNSPRTCEYYYVFADGKTNEAVGVAATPESIEFIKPGQTHERLGEGIKDAIVLSAGSRLEELRRRVTDKHGQIDSEVGQWLMSRPVAMSSNLHNVLFVPADGVLYVANASHNKPAAEMPYVKIDLKKMLDNISGKPSVAQAP